MDSLDQTSTILLIIAAILALISSFGVVIPMTPRRNRWLSLLGALIGTVAGALGVVYFIAANNPSLDAISMFLGSYFVCAMLALIVAVALNFLSYVVGQQGGSSLEI
jgi:uncharacterized membrane protein